jgi:hypothetical protein
MATFYEVWDDSTGNRLGEFDTLAEARALLGMILNENGPAAVSTLAVLLYTPSVNDTYDVGTVLEGTDFLARDADRVSRPAS